METIFGYTLGAWASPTHVLIVVAILSAFGYWLYHWVRHEPKAPGAEPGPRSPGAEWWKGL